jgi:hypothetical protein
MGYRRTSTNSLPGSNPLLFWPVRHALTRAFCGACGGSVSYEDERLPGEVYLHAGLFDDPESFPPLTHSWHSQAIGWLRIEDQLPRHERSSRPR